MINVLEISAMTTQVHHSCDPRQTHLILDQMDRILNLYFSL